ncbi:BRO1-like domain-containing protein [Lipomyces oligophaga]|uniref:BRO1-like domain-containing protein n=1 Tax=Lipomyces oligophaga TaxID=45792 RepID=UPI0034CF1B47
MMVSNMLSIPLRRTDQISLTPAIRSYIETSYDQHPDMFKNDIAELERLRSEVASLEVRLSSCEKFTRYFVQLTYLSVKFPADIKVNFVWYNSLGYSSAAVTHPDLQYERANILYNLGALYSQLGVQENRATADGLRIASQYFQFSAGCLTFLKEHVLPEMKMNPPEDLVSATLDVLIFLMLAQAQECFWQKAILDNLKNSLVARLASQVSAFYSGALDCTIRTNAIRSEWINHLTCKKFHFEAATQYRTATDCLAASKFGEEIARLLVALEAVKKALSSAKNVSSPVSEDLKGLQTKLKSDLARAEKDNDLIYLQMVPAASSLTVVKNTSTVSAIVPNPIANFADAINDKYGPSLFSNLVPFAAHVAASIYVERRDTLVNKLIISQLDVLTVQLHDSLTRLGLPGSLQALERPVGLPPTLVSHIGEVQALGGNQILIESIEDVRSLSQVDSSVYDEALTTLNIERKEDAEYRRRYGTTTWRRPTSEEAGKELFAQAATLGELLKVASESDEIVRSKFRENENSFKLLDQDVVIIEKYVPNEIPSAKADAELEKRTAETRERMNEVSRFEYRRRKFIEDLREKAQNDDVTQLVLKETARLEQMDPLGKIEATMFEKQFTTRLKGLYDEDKKRLDKESEEQSRLLTEIELTNMDFSAALAKARGSVASARETAIQRLETAYFQYKELMTNLEDGRKFYNDFSRSLTQFQDEVNDFVFSRRIDARETESELAIQLDRLNLGDELSYNQTYIGSMQAQQHQRTESPLPAPRAQGLPPAVLGAQSRLWNPEAGIQFGNRKQYHE